MNLLTLLGKTIADAQNKDRKSIIAYRPEYNTITGSVEGSLLLQQIYFWWKGMERKPFYKFRAPCNATQYKPGDSWTEELGFTPYQFDSALKRIAIKITQGTSRDEVFPNVLVVYWTTEERLTYYELNENNFFDLLSIAYNFPELLADYDPQILGTPEFRNYLSNCEIWLENEKKGYSNQKTKLQSNSENRNYMISENIIDHKRKTENTSLSSSSQASEPPNQPASAVTQPKASSTVEERATASPAEAVDIPLEERLDAMIAAVNAADFGISLEEVGEAVDELAAAMATPPLPEDIAGATADWDWQNFDSRPPSEITWDNFDQPVLKPGHKDYVAERDEWVPLTHCPACGRVLGPENWPIENSPVCICSTCGWAQKFKPVPPEPPPSMAAKLLTEEGRAELQAQSVARMNRQANDDWRSYRGDWHKPRQGVSAERIKEIDWELMTRTGLQCMATDKSSSDFWQKGLAQMWAESGEDMTLIRKAIDMAWKDYGSSSPSGYVNTCRKLRALKVRPPQMPGAFA